MDARWRDVQERGADRHALTTREEMRSLAVTDRMIDRALANGFLARVATGEYRFRAAPQSEGMAIAAAALAARGRVSHDTAATLLRFDTRLPAVPIRVSVGRADHHPRVARVEVETRTRAFHPVRVHRSLYFDDPGVVVDGVPCTDGARTLLDIAGPLEQDELEDAFERGRRLGVVSPAALARRLVVIGGRGRPGSEKVRRVLANTRPGSLESKLEGRVWRMIRAARLPEPVRQLRVDVARGRWYRIDFAHPELLVGIEAEGFEWHGTRARWKADRIRIAALERLGWRIIVVTWDDVALRRAATIDRIAMALGERRALTASA